MGALAVGLALVASVLFAVATALQHRAAVAVPDEHARGTRLVRQVIRSRTWWIGALFGGAGYVAHAAALGVGSLLVVQPLLVATLLFALPLSARWGGRRLTRTDWGWSAVLSVALAVFLIVGHPDAGAERAPIHAWLPAAVVVGSGMAVCLVAAALRRGTPRALLLAVATAAAYGVGSALTKGAVSLLPHGLGAFFGNWEPYLLAVAMGAGALMEQSAFQAGHLQASLPAVTVGEPVVAVALGVTVLHEHLHVRGPGLVLIAGLVAVMAAATIALARSAARFGAPERTEELQPLTGPDASRSPRS